MNNHNDDKIEVCLILEYAYSIRQIKECTSFVLFYTGRVLGISVCVWKFFSH